LTKVAVGCASLEALQNRIARRISGGVVRVPTRMRPKRATSWWRLAPLDREASMIARQQILRLDDRSDGRIDIVCSAELVVVPAKPRRAHQGWRYLEDEDAPSGEADGSGLSELPPRLYGKLAALALV
jgi:hypothetical protein